MEMRCLRFALVVWFLGVLYVQSAAQPCPAPKLFGGYFFPEQSTYPPGITLTYACDNGRKPAVDESWWATITCRNGNWSHQPQCIDEKACISPTIPNIKQTENAKRWHENGAIMRVKCVSGYEHKDHVATARCQNGKWSSLPICEKSATACSEPPKVPHAVIIHQGYGDIFAADSSVLYKCEDGFTIEEGQTRKSITCIAGTWTEGPTCRASGSNEFPTQTTPIRNCRTYPTVQNGEVVQVNEMFLRYRCNSFYRQVGPATVWCSSNGRWSETPTCKDAYCSVDTTQYPDLIPDGVKYLKDDDMMELKCVKKHIYWITQHYSLVQCINGTAMLSKCCGLGERTLNLCSGSMTK